MALIGAINEFNPETEDFTVYSERLEQYMIVNVIEDRMKVPMLITLIGSKVYGLLKNLLLPEEPKLKTYDELIDVLKKFYSPKHNIIAERFKFNKCDQSNEDTIAEYVVKLKQLANKCEFGQFLDDALRDRFVCGIRSQKIQTKLLSEETLNFKSAVQKASNMELAHEQTRELQPGAVYKYYKEKNAKFKRSENRENKGKVPENSCKHCGKKHKEENCAAKNWKCYNCGITGHTSVVCKQKRKAKVHQVEDDKEKEFEEEFSDDSTTSVLEEKKIESTVRKVKSSEFKLSKIETVSKINQSLDIVVKVSKKNLEMEVDTGASVSIVSEKEYLEKFSNLKLVKSEMKLKAVSGQNLEVLGEILVEVERQGRLRKLPLVIVKNKISNCLMGRNWLDCLLPDWRESLCKQVVDKGDKSVWQIQNLYPKVFDESRKDQIKDFKASLIIKENVIPIFKKAYNVPYRLQSEVEAELKLLEENKLIERVRNSAWASPLVVVPKNGGGIRLCVDFKATVNLALNVDMYPLPKPDDLFASLSEGKVFCVIDLKNAYQQLALTEESQKYMVVNTHIGLFKYKRLPYGVASAPSIFQNIMDQILVGLSGVKCYLDDILICGKDFDSCKNRLITVLEKLNEYNIKVNLKKCQFFRSSVEYLGHKIDSEGIHPTEAKLEAIRRCPRPECVTQLKSFLGLLNFYSKFLCMPSTILRPLNELLEKNKIWKWSEECEWAFQKSKMMIEKNDVLVHYNTELPIIIVADASPYGVGAVLCHQIDNKEKPIYFASATLTTTQRKYSQYEREALALIFAIRKFHKYIYGQKFTIYTDAQVVQKIFGEKRSIPTLAAARLQRWALILSAYQYEIKYRKDVQNADLLSRLPLKEMLDEEECVFRIEEPVCSEEIADETNKDALLVKVKEMTLNGWPRKIDDETLMPYFKRKEEISVNQNCLLWYNRVIIPSKARSKLLELMHHYHDGVVKMKMQARSTLWWPGIDQDIEKEVAKCETCQLNQNLGGYKNLTPWPITTKVFERVHIDYLKFSDVNILVLIDSHTRWIEAWGVKHPNAKTTIEKLRSVFATFGIPVEIVSDNGQPFSSDEFIQFCNRNKIKVTKSPPYHPPSNGLAEKAVQIIKSKLKKMVRDCEKDNKTFDIKLALVNVLFNYRNVPSTATGKSPAEIILKQRPRTYLSMVKPEYGQVQKKKTIDCSKITSFNVGQGVLVKVTKANITKWYKGTIENKVSATTYLVRGLEDKVVRLYHVDQMRKSEMPNEGKEVVPKQPPMVVYFPEAQKEHIPEDIPIDDKKPLPYQSPVRTEVMEEERTDIRRSTRTRKKPSRLDL